MKIKSKKGTTMVEASMIFPLVIAAVMAIIYMVVALYISISLQSSIHISARNESGIRTETIYRQQETKVYPMKDIRLGLNKAVLIEKEKEYKINGLFSKKIKREEFGRSYIIDDTKIVRMQSLADEVRD